MSRGSSAPPLLSFSPQPPFACIHPTHLPLFVTVFRPLTHLHPFPCRVSLHSSCLPLLFHNSSIFPYFLYSFLFSIHCPLRSIWWVIIRIRSQRSYSHISFSQVYVNKCPTSSSPPHVVLLQMSPFNEPLNSPHSSVVLSGEIHFKWVLMVLTSYFKFMVYISILVGVLLFVTSFSGILINPYKSIRFN